MKFIYKKFIANRCLYFFRDNNFSHWPSDGSVGELGSVAEASESDAGVSSSFELQKNGTISNT